MSPLPLAVVGVKVLCQQGSISLINKFENRSNHANANSPHSGPHKCKGIHEGQLNDITVNTPTVAPNHGIVTQQKSFLTTDQVGLDEVNTCTRTARVISDQFPAKESIAGHDFQNTSSLSAKVVSLRPSTLQCLIEPYCHRFSRYTILWSGSSSFRSKTYP